MASFKSYRVDGEPALITHDGKQVPYIPKEIVGHRDAYAASLHLVLKHTADFHLLMVECISEKFNIPADEIIKAIHDDERFSMSLVNPMIHTMGYFDSEILDMKLAAKPSGLSLEPRPSGSSSEAAEPEAKAAQEPEAKATEPEAKAAEPVKKKIIRKKANPEPSTQETAAPAPEPLVQEASAPTSVQETLAPAPAPAAKKKIIKKKV